MAPLSREKIRSLLQRSGVMGLLDRTGLKGPLTKLGLAPWAALDRIALRRDYASTTKSYGFLVEAPRPADPGKQVLLVNMEDWIADVKIDALMGKAVQLQGYSPVVMTSRSSAHALRYFRGLGYDSFLFFEELLEEVPLKSLEEEAQELLAGPLTPHSLAAVQYRGSYVGRHVVSTLVRKLRQGSIDFAAPEVLDEIRQALPRAMQAAAATDLALDRVQPQVMLCRDRGYIPYGQIADVAVSRGVPTVRWSPGHRPDALVLKRYGPENRHAHPFSVSTETWDLAQRMPWLPRHEAELMDELRARYQNDTWFNQRHLQEGKRLVGAPEVQRRLGLDPAKKTAIVFPHVLWDATFLYGESLFEDYEQWLVETIRVACANRAVNWVVKLHPDYMFRWKARFSNGSLRELVALDAEIGQLPGHIQVMGADSDISTFSLFEVADYCLTVRGTIGIEMACFGVPVFTAGTGRYSGLGFTIDSESRGEYLERIAHIQDTPRLSDEETLLAKRHAYALFKLRPWVFSTFEQVERRPGLYDHPLQRNILVHARSLQEFASAPDLRAFAEWATNGGQPDFLTPGTAS